MCLPSVGFRTALGRLWLLCAALSAPLCAGGYVFPLRGETALTSTFGEYRSRHFHGGLDLSTGGETGREVRAVASGYVWRVRVSGDGYGKALYLKLKDGRTAVYGHLVDFSPRIRKVVDAIQRESGTYRVDRILGDRGLRVSEGEIVAFSGESGAGPAHLHFELRDGLTQINPLAAGLTVPDTRPPRIRSLILTPLGPGSAVDGRNEPLSVGLRWNRGRSIYTTSRVPMIQGDIAVSCRVYDLCDGKQNRLAPYGAELRFDGELCYEVRFDSVSLGSTHHVELVYNYDYARRGGTHVLNLFCAPDGHVGLSAAETPTRGVIGVEGTRRIGTIAAGVGRHTIRAEAWDFSGNSRAAEMSVVADNAPVLARAGLEGSAGALRVSARDPDGDPMRLLVESSRDGGATWLAVRSTPISTPFIDTLAIGSVEDRDIVRVRVTDSWGAACEPEYFGPGLDARSEGSPSLRLTLEDGYAVASCVYPRSPVPEPQFWILSGASRRPIRALPCERSGPASFRAALELSDSLEADATLMVLDARGEKTPVAVEPLGVVRAHGGRESVPLPGGALLVVGERTFPDETFFRVVLEDSIEGVAAGGLVPLGRPIRCEPPTQFFEEKAALYLPAGGAAPDGARIGLYRKVGGRRWRWVGGRRYRGAMVGGDILHFSTFAVMEDLDPPRVIRLRPPNGARIRTPRPRLQARIRDEGSGVDWDSVYFRIDGEPLITAWEADRSYAWVKCPTALKPGPHRVEIRAADRAGNETVLKAEVSVER